MHSGQAFPQSIEDPAHMSFEADKIVRAAKKPDLDSIRGWDSEYHILTGVLS
jgi:hypothetical protein